MVAIAWPVETLRQEVVLVRAWASPQLEASTSRLVVGVAVLQQLALLLAAALRALQSCPLPFSG